MREGNHEDVCEGWINARGCIVEALPEFPMGSRRSGESSAVYLVKSEVTQREGEGGGG